MKRYFAPLKIAIAALLSFTTYAGSVLPQLTSQDQPWSVTASGGAGNYLVNASNSNTTIGRLALGNEMLLAGDIALGLELGLQTGNKMCLIVPQETLKLLQWFPVKTTLAPTVDLLITSKTDPLFNSAFFAQVKGGVAYRHWKINHIPVNEISQIAGELQAGFGFPITALASLSLLYQGVYGNTPNFQLNTYSKREYLTNIPTLHAVLLGLSINL